VEEILAVMTPIWWGRRFRLPCYTMPEYRRRLPHFHPENAYLFLTWRLWGTLPFGKDGVAYSTEGRAFVAQDRVLDRSGYGRQSLNDPRLAGLVAEAILMGAMERRFYELQAWVVMPNHVHLLILPHVPVRVLMRWLKGSTARSANRILGRTGQPFWQDESYDHYLRDSNRIPRTIAYIEQSPVSAGLVDSFEKWRWSSAG
jgi:putative DNA methylase